MRLRHLVAATFAAGLLAGCTSPETQRKRGGESGADVGNRREEVRMHLGAHPYWETPKLIPVEHPSLEPARHAARESRE